MKFETTRAECEGTVRFLWGDIKPDRSQCICCGDKDTPHAHCFTRFIDLGDPPQSIFPGLLVENIQDFVYEALCRLPNLEGKRVRVSVEVVGDDPNYQRNRPRTLQEQALPPGGPGHA